VFRKSHELLEEMRHSLDQLERRAQTMETILMVREPASVASGEAYEGLRKQVVNAVSERLGHLSQLAQFDHALRHGADPATLAALVDGWFQQAGLVRVDDPADPRADLLFEPVDGGTGPLQVIEPAYVDGVTGRLIRAGKARRAIRPAPRHSDVLEASAGDAR
jgi:hypothetical protein